MFSITVNVQNVLHQPSRTLSLFLKLGTVLLFWPLESCPNLLKSTFNFKLFLVLGEAFKNLRSSLLRLHNPGNPRRVRRPLRLFNHLRRVRMRALWATYAVWHQLRHFYLSVIRPILEYCSPIWHHGFTKAQAESLEAIQRRALRIIDSSTVGMPYEVALSLTQVRLSPRSPRTPK